MPALSFTEENYLKAIYNLQQQNASGEVAVNEIAEKMQTRPATVTDMLRKLSDKKLIRYEKYKKTKLSRPGREYALQVVRKHRLWEVFLHDKLGFSWDEVHEVAEELEHIRSQKLTDRLDEFLGFPRFDPHGDPIPDPDGKIKLQDHVALTEIPIGVRAKLLAVKDTSAAFLQHLERQGLGIGSVVTVKEVLPFDGNMLIHISNADPVTLSHKTAGKLLVSKD